MRTLILKATLAGVLAFAGAASSSCGGTGCPFAMLRTLVLPDRTTITTPQIYDVDLTAKDIQEVNLDSTLIPGQAGQVDAFLTTPDCAQLFDGAYTGTSASPLCTIYLGPIAPGGVSARRSLPSGKYRVIGQPWTTNTTAIRFGFDVVLWGASCSASPAAPGSGF